jgi:hypothetical protein
LPDGQSAVKVLELPLAAFEAPVVPVPPTVITCGVLLATLPFPAVPCPMSTPTPSANTSTAAPPAATGHVMASEGGCGGSGGGGAAGCCCAVAITCANGSLVSPRRTPQLRQ